MMDDRAISFSDLEFDRHAFARTRQTGGRIVQRWTPVGMPRVPAKFEHSVFYLFGLHPTLGDRRGPGGTGVFIARQSDTLIGEHHLYAVSNAHVVNPFSEIRLNTTDGKTRFIERGPEDWTRSSRADLAILDVTDDISLETDHISWIFQSDFLTEDRAIGLDVGIGDQVFMMGLFADHDGGDRNVPAARFGSIAAMPHGTNPITLGPDDNYVIPAYLNDMRSRGGFSGSPVWVWRTPADDLSFYSPEGTSSSMVFGRSFLCFLGIHRGQFQEETTVLAAENAEVVPSGTRLRIASAMTVVVPAWEVGSLMEHTAIKAQRDARDARLERITRAAARTVYEQSS